MEFETGRRRRRRRISKDSLISLARAEVREVERISNNSHRSETRFNWKEVYLTGWRNGIFLSRSLISSSSLYGFSLWGITALSKGSGLLLRCSVCMQRSRDRVHACEPRMHRCYVRHSGVHLCARSCRIRSACAPRLADGWNSRLRYGYRIYLQSTRGEGVRVMGNFVSGF